MENFVLVGKAKEVFRLIELKARLEETARINKARDARMPKRRS